MSRRQRGAVQAVCLVGLVGAVVLSCAPRESATIRPVRVGYSPFAVNIPFFVALENGYFEEAGISIEALEMPTANAHTSALLSHRIDASVSMPTLTALRVAEESAGSVDFGIILFNWLTAEHSPDGFIVGTGVSTVADLGGREVATLADVTWRAFLDVIIRKAAGEAPASIIELPPGSHVAAVSSGRIATAFTIEPILALAEGSEGVRVIGRGSMAKYIEDPLVAGGFTVSKSFAERYPAQASGYAAALLRAAAEVESNPGEHLRVLTKYTAIPGEVAGRVQLNRYVEATAATARELQNTIEVYERLGLVEPGIEAAALIWSPKESPSGRRAD